MTRLRSLILGLLGAAVLPAAAWACPICGNHGDTTTTLIIYGVFMLIPFTLAGGVAYFIRQQLRSLAPEAPSCDGEQDGGLAVPASRPRSPHPLKPELIVSRS